MLDRYLTNALTTHFGHLVEGADNIKFSVWQGEVVLHDLNLKREALDHFLPGCPVEIDHGRVGSLELRIPWKFIRSQFYGWKTEPGLEKAQCSVVLSDINLLLVARTRPYTANEGSENDDEGSNEARLSLERAVQNALDARLINRAVVSQSPTSDVPSWIKTRLAAMISNMSVAIQNIHVRYEDSGNNMGFIWREVDERHERYRPPFAAGFMLKQLSVGKSNADLADTVQREAKEVFFKNFSVYWDSNTILMAGSDALRGRGAFELLAEGALPSSYHDVRSGVSSFQPRHEYIVVPFSPLLTISFETGEGMPRPTALKAILPPCHIQISNDLLQDVVYVRKSLTVWERNRQQNFSDQALRILARRRPTSSPSVCPRAWWHYSYEAVRTFENCSRDRRSTRILSKRSKGWLGFVDSVKRRNKYVDLVRRFLESTNEEEQEIQHQELQAFEQNLLVDEIAAFRLHSCSLVSDPNADMIRQPQVARTVCLSAKYRRCELLEMAHFIAKNEIGSDGNTSAISGSRLTWATTVQCSDFSLQVSGKLACGNRGALMKFSCAFQHDQLAYQDMSWEVSSRIGDLQVLDLSIQRGGIFPSLVGPKQGADSSPFFVIDGATFCQSVFLFVTRKFEHVDSQELVSTTTTKLSALPLQIVLKAGPVRALQRTLQTAHVELSDDFQRVASRFSKWKDKQQRRLWCALAHRKKIIEVDVDVGAPTLLFPEDDQSNLLLVDLGNVRFSNQGTPSNASIADSWRLDVDQVCVSCCQTGSGLSSSWTSGKPQNLVEPFSLSFSVVTVVMQEGSGAQSQVSIVATLPRLTFNLTTSTVRFLRKLLFQWEHNKHQVQFKRIGGGLDSSVVAKSNEDTQVNRKIEFHFMVPVVSVALENDVDDRNSLLTDPRTTKVFYGSLKGSEWKVVSDRNESASRFHGETKIRSVVVTDLYQQAGDEFSLLLSSIPPPFAISQSVETASDNLVTCVYTSNFIGDTGDDCDSLKVHCNELFVEWNPETIAAIHRAIEVTVTPSTNSGSDDARNEAYFDAEEEEFYDAGSVASHDSSDSYIISEISSGESNIASLIGMEEARPSMTVFRLIPDHLLRSHPGFLNTPMMDITKPAPKATLKRHLNIEFKMSVLRINFNKETRQRRLFGAEMVGTSVSYTSTGMGSYNLTSNLENLIFSDPSSAQNGTLYRNILGLKLSKDSKEIASFLHVDYTARRKSRLLCSDEDGLQVQDGSNSHSVFVDLCKGTVKGFDSKLEVHFSPMRFVFLQQLWLEIVDYIFDGISGYEVWGNSRPKPAQFVDSSVSVVDGVSFMLVQVEMNEPEIILPVTYCSTDFVRMGIGCISIRNHYNRRPMRQQQNPFSFSVPLMQWYNNYIVTIKGVTIHSSAGKELSVQSYQWEGSVTLDWPTGPNAAFNYPKWSIRAKFSELRLFLEKADLSLLQYVLSENIGECSRHMHEWYALQQLPALELARLERRTLVKFGYDNKDAAPSTYDISFELPVVFAVLKVGSDPLASVSLRTLQWRYTKTQDRVSNQKFAFDLEVRNEADCSTILSKSSNLGAGATMFTYSSTFNPNSDGTKELTVSDTNVCVAVPVWMAISRFLSDLPKPTFLSPKEFIQVGDRWYRIGEHSQSVAKSDEPDPLPWLSSIPGFNPVAVSATEPVVKNGSRFGVRLFGIRVSIGSDSRSPVFDVESLHYDRRMGLDKSIARLELNEVTLCLSSSSSGSLPSTHNCLIEPFSLSITEERDGVDNSNCVLHSINVSAERIRTRVKYSDLIVLMDVAQRINRDFRSTSASSSKTVGAQSSPSRPEVELFFAAISGLDLTVVDDSGRHFAGSQDLLQVSTGAIDYRSEKKMLGSSTVRQVSQHVRLENAAIIDCLQSSSSVFRMVLRLTPCTVSSSEAEESSELKAVEILFSEDETSRYRINVGSVDIQYNPSMIIALQRFLGRFTKAVVSTKEDAAQPEIVVTEPRNSNYRGTLGVGRLSVCFNKEHQGRKLFQAVVTTCQFELERQQGASRISGLVMNFDSFRPEHEGTQRAAFLTACGTGADGSFLRFRYQTTGTKSSFAHVPDWLNPHLSETDKSFDDFLEVSVSELKAVVYSEFLAELVDYLGNGMPGRGMGATSRAAKGFVEKRIQKKSFFHLEVDTPLIIIPSATQDLSHVALQLGTCGIILTIFRFATCNLQQRLIQQVILLLTAG